MRIEWNCLRVRVCVCVTSSGKYYAHVKWIRKCVVSNCLHTAESNANDCFVLEKWRDFFCVASIFTNKLIIVVFTRVHRISLRVPHHSDHVFVRFLCTQSNTALTSQREPQIKYKHFFLLLFRFCCCCYSTFIFKSIRSLYISNTCRTAHSRIANAWNWFFVSPLDSPKIILDST